MFECVIIIMGWIPYCSTILTSKSMGSQCYSDNLIRGWIMTLIGMLIFYWRNI